MPDLACGSITAIYWAVIHCLASIATKSRSKASSNNPSVHLFECAFGIASPSALSAPFVSWNWKKAESQECLWIQCPDCFSDSAWLCHQSAGNRRTCLRIAREGTAPFGGSVTCSVSIWSKAFVPVQACTLMTFWWFRESTRTEINWIRSPPPNFLCQTSQHSGSQLPRSSCSLPFLPEFSLCVQLTLWHHPLTIQHTARFQCNWSLSAEFGRCPLHCTDECLCLSLFLRWFFCRAQIPSKLWKRAHDAIYPFLKGWSLRWAKAPALKN